MSEGTKTPSATDAPQECPGPSRGTKSQTPAQSAGLLPVAFHSSCPPAAGKSLSHLFRCGRAGAASWGEGGVEERLHEGSLPGGNGGDQLRGLVPGTRAGGLPGGLLLIRDDEFSGGGWRMNSPFFFFWFCFFFSVCRNGGVFDARGSRGAREDRALRRARRGCAGQGARPWA